MKRILWIFPLDIKIQIAIKDYKTWLRLMMIDDEFRTFVYSTAGRLLCVSIFTEINVDSYGVIRYILFGKRHRENDKPAVIRPDGSQKWYINDLLHRENDQPAVIDSDGTKYWYISGKFHRENGQPAEIYPDGTKYWYINGIEYFP